jgi:hypothetical protein
MPFLTKARKHMDMRHLTAFVLALSVLASMHGAESYKLRPEGAGAIAKRNSPLPTADRIEIYVTGPKWDVDLSTTIAELRRRKPEHVLTARNEAAQLFARLKSKEEKPSNKKLKARDGYTYHLLVYQEGEKTMTHIRVLDAGDGKEGASAEVYPNPTTAFSYLNDEVGPWLQANVKIQHIGRK